ncbi:hypothetical protein QBC38DRAFT_489368 [Podospora fimiseda]|uniref:AIG1-type G domain-containing protein n=1 Tax=Podospora fimiseda TaxID=252190 RepID=A0AAN6YNR0_9PEZI|nr:hypothetical protein QBC38DRAFT_489368 [Podospora fimiseda]
MLSHYRLCSYESIADSRRETVTQDAVSVSCTIDRRPVTLIDTPGFNDKDRTEVQILRLISKHLMEKYQEGTKLNGIIFLQPIVSTSRVTGSEATITRLFKALLGRDSFDRVVIAGTHWYNIQNGPPTEAERQTALKRIAERTACEELWGDMVAKGAQAVPYLNTQEDARRIVSVVSGFRAKDILIQKELMAGKSLEETAAGKELNKQKNEELALLRDELRALKSDRDATEMELDQLRRKIEEKDDEIFDLKRGC